MKDLILASPTILAGLAFILISFHAVYRVQKREAAERAESESTGPGEGESGRGKLARGEQKVRRLRGPRFVAGLQATLERVGFAPSQEDRRTPTRDLERPIFQHPEAPD